MINFSSLKCFPHKTERRLYVCLLVYSSFFNGVLVPNQNVWLSRFSVYVSLFCPTTIAEMCDSVCTIWEMGALTVTDTTNDMLRVNARFRYISSNIYAMCVRYSYEVSHNRNRRKKSSKLHSIKHRIPLTYERIVIDPVQYTHKKNTWIWFSIFVLWKIKFDWVPKQFSEMRWRFFFLFVQSSRL